MTQTGELARIFSCQQIQSHFSSSSPQVACPSWGTSGYPELYVIFDRSRDWELLDHPRRTIMAEDRFRSFGSNHRIIGCVSASNCDTIAKWSFQLQPQQRHLRLLPQRAQPGPKQLRQKDSIPSVLRQISCSFLYLSLNFTQCCKITCRRHSKLHNSIRISTWICYLLTLFSILTH